MEDSKKTLNYSTLIRFFIPLSLSSSLVICSQLIVNSTLARAPDPELAISSYAIGFALFMIMERPISQLRQTCTAWVKDKQSFNAMRKVVIYVWFTLLCLGLLFIFTPLGNVAIQVLYRTDLGMASSVIHILSILLIVTFLSSMRSLYQGVLIKDMNTKWMTIGIALRLTVMFLLSIICIHSGMTINVTIGAWMLLAGYTVETGISVWVGRKLVHKLESKRVTGQKSITKRIFNYYKPMFFSSILYVFVGPSIQAILGRTDDIKLAIASYTVALGIFQLGQSLVIYMHQVVLNFHKLNSKVVRNAAFWFSFMPVTILIIFSLTPIGRWVMEHLMGLSPQLIEASLNNIVIFILMAMIFPWIDYCNGLVMLKNNTGWFIISQGSNIAFTIIALFILTIWAPHWNGLIGALAQTTGVIIELMIIIFVVKKSNHEVNEVAK
jgi:progressive ankylosis protein